MRCEATRVWGDGGDREAMLVYARDALAAVLSRLDADDVGGGDAAGSWFVEAGFGSCGPVASTRPEPFVTLDAAAAWVREHADR